MIPLFVSRLFRARVGLALAAGLALTGCPTSSEKQPSPSAPTTCTAVGAPCEFSPGKLGSCVQKDECAKPPCFVCQSQH